MLSRPTTRGSSRLLRRVTGGSLRGYFSQCGPTPSKSRFIPSHLPDGNILPLYRRLLELNADELLDSAFGVRGDLVILTSERSTDGLDASEIETMITSVAEYAHEYTDGLITEFGGRRASETPTGQAPTLDSPPTPLIPAVPPRAQAELYDETPLTGADTLSENPPDDARGGEHTVLQLRGRGAG